MDRTICHDNHDKIVALYNHLKSKDGKKEFDEKIQFLKDNKMTVKMVLPMYWDEVVILLHILKTLAMRIVNEKLSNKNIQDYSANLYQVLNKIDSPNKLYDFIYKLIDEKSLYNRLVKFYEILTDKTQCMKLFKEK